MLRAVTIVMYQLKIPSQLESGFIICIHGMKLPTNIKYGLMVALNRLKLLLRKNLYGVVVHT